MTSSRQQLAEYQAKLLELLDSEKSVCDVQIAITELAGELTAENATAQSENFQPDMRMTEVAMNLTKKWGVRR